MSDLFGRLTPEQLKAGADRLVAAVLLFNPECQQRKHPNCDGRAWDHETDTETNCRCACHRGSDA